MRPRTGHRAEGAQPEAERRRRAEQRAHEKRRSAKEEKQRAMCPETLENDGPEGPKWRQNGSKMAPWRALGSPWVPTLLPEAPRSPPGGSLGRPGGAKKIVVGALGASWGEKLVDFMPPGGPREAAGGSRGGSGRPFWSIFAAGPCGTKKATIFIEIS